MLSNIATNISLEKLGVEQKKKFIKSLTSIIKKLKDCKDSKKEQYLKLVREKFHLKQDEKFVVTKLRMMLVQLNASFECFQIRKAEKQKNGKKKKQCQTKETKLANSRKGIKSKAEVKDKKLGKKNPREILEKKLLEKLTKSMKKDVEDKKLNIKKPRKTLEERQLEKLRNKTFHDEEIFLETSKIEFLKSVNLHSRLDSLTL